MDIQARLRRKRRMRRRLLGTTERPRLSVFRSARHIYAQVIDDSQGTTVAAVSTQSKDLVEQLSGKNKTDAAALVGEAIAKACSGKGIAKVVFDRNGFIYHGRVRALAEGARKGGLDF
ncbi:MAG: 50S ribosomal protein L18 [Sandaracinaceae bacterium]